MARVLDLHIALRGRTPRVWRRLRVPADLTLADLHRAIQIVMRWDDVRAHVFDVAGREYGPEPEEEEIALHWAGDDRNMTVGKAAKADRVFEYTYDFGEENRVEITVQHETASAPPHIECLGGGDEPFDVADANARLAEEFVGRRSVGPMMRTPEDRLAADLTLLLLFLGSWEEGRGTRAAYKTMRFEILDALQTAGLVVTNTHRKSVDLTAEGVQRAEALLQRVLPLLPNR